MMPSLEELKARAEECEKRAEQNMAEANHLTGAATVLRGLIAEIEAPEEAVAMEPATLPAALT